MKKLRMLWRILQSTNADKITTGFIAFVILSAGVFTMIEPGITHFGDGVWYAFAVFTTIGFGDLIAVTLTGRILTIILSLYGILVVALIPAVVVSYFMELSNAQVQRSMMEFLDRLEHLPDLSKDELIQLSSEIKKRRNKL